MNDSQAVRISIVIPAYHEADGINAAIAHLRALDPNRSSEIIVVDGASGRDTIAAIEDPAVVTLGSPRGRGRQMNAGAAVARGEILLFLHADTLLPAGGLATILEVMADSATDGGAFELAFDSKSIGCRAFARLATWRARLTRVPFGDQAIFVRRSCFVQLGGFNDIPIMEDVDLMVRARSGRHRIRLLRESVVTSSRRLNNEGLVYCLVRGAVLIVAFHIGISPRLLKKCYSDHHREPMRSLSGEAPGGQGSAPGRSLIQSGKKT